MSLEPVPEDWDRCLAVVAHPDDLEYGAAAALARWTAQGKSAIEVLATRGEAGITTMEPAETARVRTAEQEASAAIVGAEGVEFLEGHHDGMLTYGLDLRRDLARAIRRHRPDVVITISFREGFYGGGAGWNHADHRVVGEALVDAVRDAGNRWVFPELVEEGHEPWDGTRFVLAASSPRSTHYVDISDSIDDRDGVAARPRRVLRRPRRLRRHGGVPPRWRGPGRRRGRRRPRAPGRDAVS